MGQVVKKIKPRKHKTLRKKRLISLILARMSDGWWLRKSCRYYGVSVGSAMDWVDEFNLADQYARAKENLGHAVAEDTIELSESAFVSTPEGKIDPAWVNYLRLQIDTRKWLISKITKQYSERKDVNLSGELNTKTTIVPTFKQFVESNVKAS